jgi:hypothetical protein
MGQPAVSAPLGTAYFPDSQKPGVFAMVFALSLQVDGTVPCLHMFCGRITGAGQPERSAPFGAKYPPEGQKMVLSIWMKYVPWMPQPDSGKAPKMQVTLLPPLGLEGTEALPPPPAAG